MTTAGLAQKAFRVLVAVPLMTKAYHSLFYRRPMPKLIFNSFAYSLRTATYTWIELGLVGSFR